VQGAALDLGLTGPLSDRFPVLGHVGGQYAMTRTNFSGGSAVTAAATSPSDRQLNDQAGVGVQSTFSPNFLLLAKAEQYRVRDASGGHARVQVASLSAVFSFGAVATSSRRAMMLAA